ncbi:hypothetical protein BHE74_00054354 [Ensete ventricosum]|nr:hypothetical protein BHE74_00054354 [Ensete ventricosum]RZR91355.1 hypothetical protein BHM03_00019463 [Ensete ventricosum]
MVLLQRAVSLRRLQAKCGSEAFWLARQFVEHLRTIYWLKSPWVRRRRRFASFSSFASDRLEFFASICTLMHFCLVLQEILPARELTDKMQNEAGEMTDLYIPRKCSATNRLITAKDHASVQINIGHLDESGVYTGQFTTFALSGFIRAQVCSHFLTFFGITSSSYRSIPAYRVYLGTVLGIER